MIEGKQVVCFDSEIVPSHYLFSAKRLSDGKGVRLWGGDIDEMERLGTLLNNPEVCWVGFNSNNFDIPLAIAASYGRTVTELKAMADDIINNGKPAWMTMRDYGIEYPENLNTIDLIEVAPGVMVSLKLYGGRMASPSIIDMPFHHDQSLTDDEAKVLALYCDNDIAETERLYRLLEGQLALREKMSDKYRINLMSKSDAQMAETIIAKELGLLRAGKSEIPKTVRYNAPPFVQPANVILQDILQRCEKHVFTVNQGNGAVELPAFLSEQPVLIGDGRFQMGIGGLHSQHDRSVHYAATPEFEIVDADVGSFYPWILLNAGFVPRGLGGAFVSLYRGFVETRLDAKHRVKVLSKLETLTPGEETLLKELKVLDAGGKIMINGTFGKLGSCFSKIYAPDLMLGITLTGQFYLLSVIDHITALGGKVISANTDGITFGAHPDVVKKIKSFIDVYGWTSNFEFECIHYKSVSMKDCNNYIAVKTNGDIKAKGLYAPSGLQKNPTNEVCGKAAAAFIASGTPIKDFILQKFSLENFPDFLQVRTVKGGAVEFTAFEELDDWMECADRKWYKGGDTTSTPVNSKSRPAPYTVGLGGTKLGRVARWYYSTDPACAYGLRYVSNNNLVPKSSGGRSCLTLPNQLPADVDIQRYIDETVEHLANMGVFV